MNQPHKRTAIILVNWNSFDYTAQCIASLNRVTPNDFTIVVVDNGSNDFSGQQLKERFPHIILIESATNLGFTGGNNLGLEYSLREGFEYSMLLNNDTEVAPDFLQVLTDHMDHNPGTGVIQPKIFYHHDRTLLWDGGSYFNPVWGIAYTKGLGKQPGNDYNTIKKVDWVTGCGFLTRNSILQKSGLLAKNFFIYYEDVDLSFRIKKLGYQLVFHPDSVIFHIAGASNKRKEKGKEGFVNPVVHYLNTRNRIWLLKEHTPFYYIPTVFMYTFFYTLTVMLYFAARFRFKKLAAVGKAVKDGLSGRVQYK